MIVTKSFKRVLASGSLLAMAAALLPAPAAAQVVDSQTTTQDAATPTGAAVPDSGAALSTGSNRKELGAAPGEILVTGSRIRQNPNNSALPLQIVTTADIERNGLSSPEQVLSFLTDNGNSADNLASNSDVVTAERRGNNGASFANLRGQGSAATLVLLNGRRVAAQGTTGSAVDVNQIPFMALDRVEVLKDGASAIYGTDAVGGVINFITKKNYKGFGASAYNDITGEGDSPIRRVSGIAGFGDLDEQGWNVMGTVGYSWIAPLEAHSRDFVNTFQHDRGLGVDTRGTPFATIVNFAGTSFPTTAAFPLIPGTGVRATGGINVLRLPGQAGCGALPDEADYDTDVWGNPGNGLACSYDTGKNVYLQQKLNTLTYYGRATKRFGSHEITAEITGSDADSAKRFSPNQLSPSTSATGLNYVYKRVPGVNDAAFNDLISRVNATFPGLLNANSTFSYRLRCIDCGEREISTNTKTFRAALNATGPLFRDWDYSVGAQYADSVSSSLLGAGYYYTQKLQDVLNSGYFNPFLFPGQSQSPQATALLQAASAQGVKLYGGKYSVKQADASVSGSLFDLPGGTVKLAAGVDFRREEYHFDGDKRQDPNARANLIYNAPFDNGNALDGVHRTIKAAYAEVLIPVVKGLEVSAAGRIDDYSGFGTTTNPKVSIKYRPFKPIMFRGSYNTAFRVPTFNQLFNPVTAATYTGSDFADPKNCAGGKVNAATGCVSLNNAVNILSGGHRDLGPETAREFSAGVVIEPSSRLSASVDWWSIHRDNTIQVLPLQYLFANYDALQSRFIRDSTGVLQAIDDTYANAGTTRTQGIDITVRGSLPLANGATVAAGIDGTWLIQKDEKINASAARIEELGVYSLASDLGLKWKHNAFIAYTTNDWSLSLTQIFRSGYKNQVLPGILAGTFDPCCDVARVKDYITYTLSASYSGVKGLKLTFGIKNLFDKDPPFAISYDSNNGTGSSWEPRVADPRGRSFTMLAEVKF